MGPRILAFLLAVSASLITTNAYAQIKQPGAHEQYSVELEPHLVVQWVEEPWWDDEGFGLGFHASFPVIDNGPVTTINNNLAISVGLDWANFDDPCRYGNIRLDDDCSANDFWLPVVVQWNFFFSDLISAFPELGLAIQHSRYDNDVVCRRGNDYYVCGDDSDTDLELALWLGVRFHVASGFAITLRLGTPSLLLGASFFL